MTFYINKKSLFPKFQLTPVTFQVMHDYVCFIASIDYCVELRLINKTFYENCSHFILKWVQSNSFWELVLRLRRATKRFKKFKFEHSESAFYLKSGCIPLTPLERKFWELLFRQGDTQASWSTFESILQLLHVR